MLSAAIEMLGSGQLVEKTVSFDGDLRRRGVPFGFAQGRLSTSFGWRLTSIRKTGISWLTRFLLAHWRERLRCGIGYSTGGCSKRIRRGSRQFGSQLTQVVGDVVK